MTGFMVDGVSEVLRLPTSSIRLAPEVSSEQMRLIGRVANLDAQNRMILLVIPQAARSDQTDVLLKFDRNGSDCVSTRVNQDFASPSPRVSKAGRIQHQLRGAGVLMSSTIPTLED